jgi:HEAT repeat protein
MDGELATILANLMALKGLYEETNPYLQRYAATALGKLAEPVAFEALVAALKYDDPALRAAILGAIDGYLRENARTTQQVDPVGNILVQTVEVKQPWLVEHLIRATHEGDSLVRAGVQAALEQMDAQQILSFAVAAESADPGISDVALAQIERLLNDDPETAIPRLLALPMGRQEPCTGLILALGTRAADPLISALPLESEGIHAAASDLLLAIGLPAVIPLYNRVQRIRELFSRQEQSPGYKSQAHLRLVDTLDRLRQSICRRHIAEVRQEIMNRTDPLERRAFFETFTVQEGIYSDEMADLFAQLIDDPDPVIASRCALELAKRHDVRAIPRLLAAIQKSDEIIPPVKAVGLLTPYHTPEVTRALFAALESEQEGVGLTALEILAPRQDLETLIELLRYHTRLSPHERRRVLPDEQRPSLPDWKQRSETLGVHLDRLILKQGERIIEPCIACFTDANAGVRQCSVRLVGQIESSRADRALLVALETGPNDVVNEAQKWLSDRFDLASVPELMRISEQNDSAYVRSAAKRVLGIYFTNRITGEAVLTGLDLRPDERCRLLMELHARGRLGGWDVIGFVNRFLRDHPECRGAKEALAHQSHLRPATGGTQAMPPAEMVRPAEEPEPQKRPFWQR